MADPSLAPTVDRWLRTIGQYEAEFKQWEKTAQKIVRKYRDDSQSFSTNRDVKFNILWSNVQTLIPAVYAKLPKADVSRRFGDNDPIGRVASLLIERALDFEIEHYPDFRSSMQYSVEDRFLGGRGVAWVRYEPHVRDSGMPEDGFQITEDTDEPDKLPSLPPGEAGPEDTTAGQSAPLEEIDYECAPTDYVHWKDFGHSLARTWEEVACVWRWVYMTKEALVERFGEEKAASIPLDSGPDAAKTYSNKTTENIRAKICELWDRESGKVFWFSKSGGDFIDVRDDPMGLEQFFPCPKPLYATTTSDSLVPVPDFKLYQDQARELDVISDRIDGLVQALRVRGVYDSSQPALQRLFTEGENNALIPVERWGAFAEKGGLKGSVDLVPLDMLAQALTQCYRAREEIKAQIYEITGISDIIRGATAATETATAQQIKGQYAGLRLRSMQESVAMFATELFRLKAQVICTKFQPETILKYAAADQMSPADRQMIPQALALLKQDPLRNFRIDVASDSLVQIDEDQNKQDRLGFIQALGGFLNQALPVAQASPEIVPMLVDVMKFGIAAFKGARQLEGSLDQMLDGFQQAQAQKMAQGPQQSPEAIKAQVQQQTESARAQADMAIQQHRAQTDMQMQQMKAQLEIQQQEQTRQHEAALRIQEMRAAQQADFYKAELDALAKIMVANINANTGDPAAQIGPESAALQGAL